MTKQSRNHDSPEFKAEAIKLSRTPVGPLPPGNLSCATYISMAGALLPGNFRFISNLVADRFSSELFEFVNGDVMRFQQRLDIGLVMVTKATKFGNCHSKRTGNEDFYIGSDILWHQGNTTRNGSMR